MSSGPPGGAGRVPGWSRKAKSAALPTPGCSEKNLPSLPKIAHHLNQLGFSRDSENSPIRVSTCSEGHLVEQSPASPTAGQVLSCPKPSTPEPI